ncbi:MAG TPA: hypothetical protein PKI20_16895 [Verrucomicrobiota bacterium]|nr:hypothetical protein [Verrucomicrobiota bacterium]
MTKLERYMAMGQRAGCPRTQMDNFVRAGVVLQERQLAASAAARLCDRADGPTAVGYGGARGGGKSHWLLAQMGADDCQRVPGLKCLLLRKVGKANMEHFEDLRRRLFVGLRHEFSAYRGVLTFGNGSRIIAGHFQAEKDIDAYLGLEYDVIGIEEATTLSSRKHTDISTCCRTSKSNWRPRIYSTSNPGGIGHAWYRTKFIVPFQETRETETRFLPARVTDNAYNNPEYRKVLESLHGWQRKAWLDGTGTWQPASTSPPSGARSISSRTSTKPEPASGLLPWTTDLPTTPWCCSAALMGMGTSSSWMNTPNGCGCLSGTLRPFGRWWAATRSATGRWRSAICAGLSLERTFSAGKAMALPSLGSMPERASR